MEIKVLGSGCKNCQKLYENANCAIEEMKTEGNVEKVTEFSEIAKYNVMKMPALVVDGKVVSSGRIPSKQEIIEILRNE